MSLEITTIFPRLCPSMCLLKSHFTNSQISDSDTSFPQEKLQLLELMTSQRSDPKRYPTNLEHLATADSKETIKDCSACVKTT
jgi:hypothetical protein